MYARCISPLAMSQQVFDESPYLRDVVSWTALIAGYAQEEKGHEALKSFGRMQKEGLSPNEITFTCILKACGNVGAIDKGIQIHDEIIKGGWLAQNIVLGNALVDMYAKCGILSKALKVFEELPVRDTISWSALISGYAQEGHFEEALKCFAQMQKEGLSPDDITFVSVLNACSHSGKIDEAQDYYENMKSKYGIAPKIEHYTCMLDLLGRAGHLEEAMSMGQTLSLVQSSVTCRSLMGACYNWGNVELGRQMFKSTLHS